MAELTHAELVGRAARWLRNTRGCSVVTTKAILVGNELPDAIGWNGHARSILVECKVSRADFLRDQKKTHRLMPSLGMGYERFYLTPPGLLSVEEIPRRWGLLECHPNRIAVRLGGFFQPEVNRVEEVKHLVAMITRSAPPFAADVEEGCLHDAGL